MHSFDLVLVVAQITSAPRWTHNQGSRIVCWRHELLGAIHKFEHLVEVKVVDDWKPTFEVLEEWIQTYVEKVQDVPDFLEKCEKIPEKATDMIKNA